jgi:SAM-dependent methyltransferase
MTSTDAVREPGPGANWASGDIYEPYVGRWSRLVAREFVPWLAVPAGATWLDVGCGTGALSATILAYADPEAVTGVDPSEAFIAWAGAHVRDARARFEVGDARALLGADATFDVAVSGLVLNFVPEPEHAVEEMARVVRPGGSVGAYVWDYADRMEMMRRFWDAASALDPAASEADEGRRFPICQPGPLGDLFRDSGLREVGVRAIDIPTVFRDFDDYWTPFLGGGAPAPRYALSLDEEHRAALRASIRSRLTFEADGSIYLIARAWAVRGRR